MRRFYLYRKGEGIQRTFHLLNPKWVYTRIKERKSDQVFVEREQKLELLERPDPKLPTSQWPLTKINIEAAHQMTKGEGVKIVVMDSGIDYTHREFNPSLDIRLDFNLHSDARMKTMRASLLHRILNGREHPIKGGYNYTSNERDFWDDNRHGTAVASIISAQNHKMLGIAPQAELICYKVVDARGSGPSSRLIPALEDAINQDKPDIISFSLAYPFFSHAVHDLLEQCIERNILLIAAMGNNNAKRKKYPAATTFDNETTQLGLIAVGGTNSRNLRWNEDDTGQRTFGANIGAHIDVSASAAAQPVALRFFNQYTMNQGTSLAAPAIAGIAALIISLFKTHQITPSVQTVHRILQKASYNEDFNPPDPTGDGVTDIFDLTLIGRHFGEVVSSEVKPPYDVNRDGEINIFDLTAVGQHFGERKGKGHTESLGFGVPDVSLALNLTQELIDAQDVD